MLGVDDEGNKFELAPDPMNEELQEQFKDIVVGKTETFKRSASNRSFPMSVCSSLTFTKMELVKRLKKCSAKCSLQDLGL